MTTTATSADPAMAGTDAPGRRGGGRGASGGGGGGGGARSARRRAREFALQGLYQWLLSREDVGAIIAHLSESPEFGRADREHFDALLTGAVRDAPTLQAALAPHLDRPIERLSPVEHAALLLATCELRRHPEIPYRVVINEAVELTKSFGGNEGYRYVNGVLDRVAADLRKVEAGGGDASSGARAAGQGTADT